MKFQHLRASLTQWRPGTGKVGRIDALRGAWNVIVGAETARHAFPSAVEGDALIVTTRSGTWSQQLGFLEPTILPQLQALPEGKAIARLVYRVGRMTLRTAPPVRRAAAVQGRLRLTDAAPPVLSLEELTARIGRQLVERERRLARKPRCKGCGIPLESGVQCAPCAGRKHDERLRHAQQVLREMPWLAAPQILELVPALSLDECRRARQSFESRLETEIERLRWRLRKGGEAKALDRTTALAYAMLVSGEPPGGLNQALLRHILGTALADALYPGGAGVSD